MHMERWSCTILFHVTQKIIMIYELHDEEGNDHLQSNGTMSTFPCQQQVPQNIINYSTVYD